MSKTTLEWLESLESNKIRALAFQHGIPDALSGKISSLREELSMRPEIIQIAGEMSGLQKKE